jgi:vesicle coat complex subunit
VDPDYVARVIRAIAKIAVRFERSVEKALGVLSRFMEEVAEHADCAEELVDALMVATQHILRKYPSRFNHNNMFGDVIKLMLRASSPEGVQAAVWINGEYAEEIYPQSIIFIKKAILTFEEGDPTMQL